MVTTTDSKSSTIPCGSFLCEPAPLFYYLLTFGIS
jgi:hypothetical protein